VTNADITLSAPRCFLQLRGRDRPTRNLGTEYRRGGFGRPKEKGERAPRPAPPVRSCSLFPSSLRANR
jgi:hypothetical protein